MDKQAFASISIVNAIPMTRQAYNDMRGWKLPENENGKDEGYLVEQIDFNSVDSHVTWVPKDAFERHHLAMGVNAEHTLPWKLRELAEKAQLDQRLSGLTIYLETEHFKSLSSAQRLLLNEQHRLMTEYSNVLQVRLDSN
ncbi:hypothetical protein RYZ59_20495 [Citrobacter sp. HN-141]|uniref:crAss001_48 related protein n=1 Tax=unclassified Citrobacter TaxID=2644389 RepID=UPI002964B770|nr:MULTISPECIES: hypothetical protein [unclassified Citrobacter]MDW2645940.1 hypothetical protein [Citrobacter sp. HN-141]MDW2655561.1 hypothetical protein [Citrobacter sp. HN-120]MDW2698587.1 hypothetical protein [Citrobacter sp. HN-144]